MPWLTLVISTLLSVETGGLSVQLMENIAGSSVQVPSKYKIIVSLRLRVQNAVPAQPCVGKFRISLVLLNFLHCNFRLWFETP